MVVGAKVCELTDGFLWFVCGLYVGILMSPLMTDFLHQPPSDLDPLDVTVTSQRHSDITSVPGVTSRFPKGGSPQVGGVLGN